MPNTFIDNRDSWLRLSEIDYLGQFVKAWLAFNAWYRNAYTETQDRKIINEIKWQPNPIRSKLRPFLTNSSSNEESEQFRGEIGLLHHRLQNYEIHSGKGEDKLRITLENIYLRDNPPPSKMVKKRRSCEFTIERLINGHVKTEVTNPGGRQVLTHTQPRYDLANLQSLASFASLTSNQQGFLTSLYKQANPKIIANLKEGNLPAIKCGAHEFKCGAESLFAGLVEVLYLLRCTLFHGELNPTKDAITCYEPAFRLVRRFLDCTN